MMSKTAFRNRCCTDVVSGDGLVRVVKTVVSEGSRADSMRGNSVECRISMEDRNSKACDSACSSSPPNNRCRTGSQFMDPAISAGAESAVEEVIVDLSSCVWYPSTILLSPIDEGSRSIHCLAATKDTGQIIGQCSKLLILSLLS